MVVAAVDSMSVSEPPATIVSGGSPLSTHREKAALAVFLIACIATRLATTIRYVEDIDSLHFALAMIDFDVAHLQPHFPGYVVFVALAQICATLAGSFSSGFALVGGLATFLLVTGMLALLRWKLASLRGALLAL